MPNTMYLVNLWGTAPSYFYDLDAYRDEVARPYIALREQIESAGFEFRLTPDGAGCGDAAALLSLGRLDPAIARNLHTMPKERTFLVLTEPPTVDPQLYHPRLADYFGTIFTMFDDLIASGSYCKFYHPQARERPVEDPPPFAQRKLCVLLLANKRSHHPDELYSERRELAASFPADGQFDIYGPGWEGYACYRGAHPQDKLALWSGYRFAICYENMRNQRGYITERLFEAFYSRCIPVYWGASNIEEYIPRDCYVDRRAFGSNEELFSYMRQLDEAGFQRYLDAASAFLRHPQTIQDYSPKSFGASLLRTIRETIQQ